MAKVCIGIPCYQGVSAETLDDYMRFAYFCGRRMPDHDFFIAIRSKAEQFRARNSIIEGALQIGCDYLLFLDDDHVIEWEGETGVSGRYNFAADLIQHLEADPTRGICGALYYHRGSECRPVIMKKGENGGYVWIRDDEIVNDLQEVDVQGGGCMMLNMKMFDKVRAPWFEPEQQTKGESLGTDLQICKKAQEAGYSVWCDTSIQIGHVMSKREVVTPENRHRIAIENANTLLSDNSGLNSEWTTSSALQLYCSDACDYLDMNMEEVLKHAERYDVEKARIYQEDMRQYYSQIGKKQLCRQVLFHSLPHMKQQYDMLMKMVNQGVKSRAADIGCGSSPVGFEFAMKGHSMDFVDIDGAGGFEFVKWRAGKRDISEANFIDATGDYDLTGPYDYVLMLDSIEHIEEWKPVLHKVTKTLLPGGALITNFFMNMDYDNPEHINMDKEGVKKFLVGQDVYPENKWVWRKQTEN